VVSSIAPATGYETDRAVGRPTAGRSIPPAPNVATVPASSWRLTAVSVDMLRFRASRPRLFGLAGSSPSSWSWRPRDRRRHQARAKASHYG